MVSLHVRVSNPLVVLGVAANPHPDKKVGTVFHGQRAIMQPNTHGPIIAEFLELQRWMTRILLEQFEILAG